MRFNGSKKEYIIADCSLLSLAQARDDARDIIKQLVNHSDNVQEAHAGYNHYTIGELRPTTQIIGDYLYNKLHSENVIELRKTA